MRLSEFLKTIKNDSRLRIYREDDEKNPVLTVFTNDLRYYGGKHEIIREDPEVVRFFAAPEIRHRLWEERGLLPPYEPEITRQYEFSDLTILLYYNVFVGGGAEDGQPDI